MVVKNTSAKDGLVLTFPSLKVSLLWFLWWPENKTEVDQTLIGFKSTQHPQKSYSFMKTNTNTYWVWAAGVAAGGASGAFSPGPCT